MSGKEKFVATPPNLIPEHLSPNNQAWLDEQTTKQREHTRKAATIRQFGIVVTPVQEQVSGETNES